MMRQVLATIMVIVAASAVSKSKLTIFSGMGDMSWSFINATHPRVLKIFDNFGGNIATKVKEVSPGTMIVGRIYLGSQPMGGNATEAAQNWWNGVKATILEAPGVDYWEGYNEVADTTDVSTISWYSQFEVARMQILQQNKLKACIGNFATGWPALNTTIVSAFYPAIKAAINEYDSIFGLHEYSAPWLDTWFTGNTTNGQGWLTGRYRMLYDDYLIPNNLTIPLVITEMGVDGGCSSNTTPIQGGYLNFCDYWAQNGGLSDCNQEYTNQLKWYDSIMLVDDYVLGATIYCEEIPGWGSWQLTQQVDNDLATYMNSL